jgi:uncharacterized protein YunC (DUF1805 family)
VETVTDSLLHELGGNGGVDTTTNSTENVIGLTNQLPNAKDFLVDELGHGPVGVGTTDVDGEVAEELGSIRGVCDFGVELNAINRLGLVRDTGILGVGGSSDGVEALWQLDKLVTVTHPYQDLLLQTSEQLVDVSLAVESLGVQVGMAVFASSTGDNIVLSKSVGNFLKTVADSKNGNTEFEDRRVSVGGT